ncbi:MAG TPA: threonine synthase [Dehalococcoidia bacterium]|nr:threonine synthase [Dehalococcoidia bacterium]
MSYATNLRCRECGRDYQLVPAHICEFCFGPLEVTYDYAALAQAISREKISSALPTMWRYKDLLPVDSDDVVDIGTGFTPLLRAENLGRALGLENLYIKNDCLNPSYSFKDRVVSVAATKAREFGFGALACASTGNLACSVAAHAARAGLEAYVFIPADLEMGKILGAAIYAPTLVAVEGNYDEVNRLCNELADRYNWAFVNINMRAYYSEGSKTLGFEVAEQLGWRAPDCALVPVASGSLLTKIRKGLKELATLGLIEEPNTRFFATQPRGCSPVVTAYEAGSLDVKPVRPDTIVKSLAIGNPADGQYALRAVVESGGAAAAVTDQEVVEGMKLLAETEGIFSETSGGVVIGCLKKLVAAGVIKSHELTVAYITGAGFKTVEAVQESVVTPLAIKPSIASFEEALGRHRAR